jgi:hypothetical protein
MRIGREHCSTMGQYGYQISVIFVEEEREVFGKVVKLISLRLHVTKKRKKGQEEELINPIRYRRERADDILREYATAKVVRI